MICARNLCTAQGLLCACSANSCLVCTHCSYTAPWCKLPGFCSAAYSGVVNQFVTADAEAMLHIMCLSTFWRANKRFVPQTCCCSVRPPRMRQAPKRSTRLRSWMSPVRSSTLRAATARCPPGARRSMPCAQSSRSRRASCSAWLSTPVQPW